MEETAGVMRAEYYWLFVFEARETLLGTVCCRFFVLRGRPGFRLFTASRSFGSIIHTFPNFVAFKRFASIRARTRFAVTPNRLAASVVLMTFMAQIITFWKSMVRLPQIH
jgi:hypothetical protein